MELMTTFARLHSKDFSGNGGARQFHESTFTAGFQQSATAVEYSASTKPKPVRYRATGAVAQRTIQQIFPTGSAKYREDNVPEAGREPPAPCRQPRPPAAASAKLVLFDALPHLFACGDARLSRPCVLITLPLGPRLSRGPSHSWRKRKIKTRMLEPRVGGEKLGGVE